MVSPLWAMYAAAAGAGVAYWWMTGWTRAVNIEAFAAFKPSPPVADALLEIAVEAAPVAELAEEAAPEPAVVTESVASEVEVAVEAAVEAMPATAEMPDDLPGITILPTHRVVMGIEKFSSPDFITKASAFYAISELNANWSRECQGASSHSLRRPR